MKLNKYIKYVIRFLTLQFTLTYFLFFYFNNFLISKLYCEYCAGFSFRMQIENNLWEDRNRFFPFISERFITIETFVIFFVFIFLIALYSTKFYTYVNELSYSIERNYLDEFFSLYLLWTSSFVIFLTIFRMANLISRGYLILLTFLVPIILLLFRNSELFSRILGRSLTGENYITFNVAEDSSIRALRIMTFRNNSGSFNEVDLSNSVKVIESIDSFNKNVNLNLIVLNFKNLTEINPDLEKYLINLNKKVLIISKNQIKFNNNFLYRQDKISGNILTYFNNDIQYGAKYILKRLIDITFSSILILLLSPVFLFTYCYIIYLDRSPAVIKQNRVGLHGLPFKMYKFRTMKHNSHLLRHELEQLNENDDVIFKITNDPRIIQGTQFLRNFSIDELPQLFNVLRGNMSLVGPRPLFVEDTSYFDKNYMRRLNVLPGITGLLQINERNTPDFETWFKYDIEYIDNWSLFLDLKIIFKTPFSIFSSKIKGL